MKLLLFCALVLLTFGYFAQGNVTPQQCSRSVLGRSGHGVIASYNYPFNYLHNLTCTYSIVLHPLPPETNRVICFTFHRFDLETSTPYCSYDSLRFVNVNLKYCGLGLWQYGGENSNPTTNVWSKQFCWTIKAVPTFDIVFNSDDNINGRGFYAEYWIFDGIDQERVQLPGNLGQAPCHAERAWTCFNRRCITREQLCDGRDDCGDGSDESYAHARCGEQNVLACDFSSRFSDGYCGFTHEGWFRTNEQHSPYGPRGDHTNMTQGYYVYTDVNESSAYLLGPELTLPLNRTYCLSFWYFIYGRPASTVLSVYISRDQAYSQPEWTRKIGPENTWVKGEIVIHTVSSLQVIFAAELDNSFSGVALDDISVLEGPCIGNDIACNFESGTCGWKRTSSIEHHQGVLAGGLQWKLHNRLVGPMGPIWDHSSRDGGGSYLYMNFSTVMPVQDRALFISPAISSLPRDPKCVTFWYHMLGVDSNACQLRIHLLLADGSLSEVVWGQRSDVRSAWKQAHIDIDQSAPFQVVMVGIVSQSGHGEIAVDQILLQDGHCIDKTSGACEPGQYLCADGQCINATLKCNQHVDCLDNSDEDWRAGCQEPPTTLSPTPALPTTLFPSTTLSPGTGICTLTQFGCHSDGTCILRSSVCDGKSDCADKSDESIIAGCAGGTSCKSREFMCKNKNCILSNQRCDGIDQCEDNSDENHHANCSLCPATEFQCVSNGLCIHGLHECDGIQHCADGSDEEDCRVVAAASGLETGAIIGIVIACVIALAVVIISALLGRKRRKQRPGHTAQTTVGRYGSEISTISCGGEESSARDRQMSMLEAMRTPMQGTLVRQPPPYSEQDLQNMGYTSDGTLPSHARSHDHINHAAPPEEPPPPYDSVIQEQIALAQARAMNALRSGSLVDDDSGQSTPISSGSRSSAGSSTATPSHTSMASTPMSPLASMSLASFSNQPPLNCNAGHAMLYSDDSDTPNRENIYEELNLATLPRTMSQSPPTSTTTSQAPRQSSQSSTQPNTPTLTPSSFAQADPSRGVYTPGSNALSTSAPSIRSPPMSPPALSQILYSPLSGAYNPETSTPYGVSAARNPQSAPATGPNSPAADSPGNYPCRGVNYVPAPAARTTPHQRIRLGTQALQSRPQQRPRNPYPEKDFLLGQSSPGRQSDPVPYHAALSPRARAPGLTPAPSQGRSGPSDRPEHREGVKYEPLDPPGPYFIRPNTYARLPADARPPSASSQHQAIPQESRPSTGGFDRNIRQPPGSEPGATYSPSGHIPQHRASYQGSPYRAGSGHARTPYRGSRSRESSPGRGLESSPGRGLESSPGRGLDSVEATPFRRPYSSARDNARHSYHHPQGGYAPPQGGPNHQRDPARETRSSNRRQRPREARTRTPPRYPQHSGQEYGRSAAPPHHNTQGRSSFKSNHPPSHHQASRPLSQHHRGSPDSLSGSRDWGDASFGSVASADRLLSSPGSGITANGRDFDPSPSHPRGGSNISSDMDSTSPLVQHRDDVVDLDSLCPTSV